MNLEQIDTSTTAGKAEVMRLAAEGRRVAYSNAGHHEWALATDPRWDWRTRDYAIIAEPVGPEEVFVAFSMAGDLLCVRHMEADAERAMRRNGSSGYVVRYIRADLAEGHEPSVPASVLRSVADRWASDRGYTGSPVDDIRALIDQPTADLAGEKG